MVTEAYPKGHPMMAQPAMQQADHFAKNLLRLSRKSSPYPFLPDKGSMATIGRHRAVAEIGNLKLGGGLAWYVWMGVHPLPDRFQESNGGSVQLGCEVFLLFEYHPPSSFGRLSDPPARIQICIKPRSILSIRLVSLAIWPA